MSPRPRTPATTSDPEVVIATRLAAVQGHVSGQALGKVLGITRAAVARRVTALRRQGFAISASPRLGYRLLAPPDRLLPSRVLPMLSTRRFGRRYLWLRSCSSTSDVAADLARRHEPEGAVAVAETQTSGRGRMGRSWHSPPGVNIYLSLLLRPPVPPSEVPPLTLLVGAALAETVQAEGIEPQLKWPNDLLLPTPAGPRKAAGVLTEMVSEMDRVRHVVVGIGLDVNAVGFPSDLTDHATSLALALGRPVDRAALLARLLATMEDAYDRFVVEGGALAVALWRRHAALGGRYRLRGVGPEIVGVAEDVESDGSLRLRDDAGRVHRVLAGELASEQPAEPGR